MNCNLSIFSDYNPTQVIGQIGRLNLFDCRAIFPLISTEKLSRKALHKYFLRFYNALYPFSIRQCIYLNTDLVYCTYLPSQMCYKLKFAQLNNHSCCCACFVVRRRRRFGWSELAGEPEWLTGCLPTSVVLCVWRSRSRRWYLRNYFMNN